MSLDRETFKHESDGVYWRFATTERLGQFDIATEAGDDWGPAPDGLAHLEHALAQIDTLYDAAITAAETAWLAMYEGTLRPRSAWSLTRLFADRTGQIVVTVYEGDFDVYGAWEVTIVDGDIVGVVRRQS